MQGESKQYQLEEIINDYLQARVSRRGFLVRAGALGLSALTAGSILAACGGESSSGGASPVATSSPVTGGTFREGYDRDFSPLDPVYSNWDDPGMNAVYEAVAIRDPQGTLVPMLCESFESTASGWTFQLRDGLKFHSGAAVTPAAVVAAYNAFRDPKVGQNAVFWTPIKSVKADGQTMTCATDGPFQAFQETVCVETSYIPNLATRKKAGEDYGSKVVDGTGPFTLETFTPGQRVVVKRWEEYPGSVVPYFANKGKAYLDGIEWVPILEASQRAAELETGNVDAVKNPPPQDVERLKSNADVVVQEYQELSNFFLWLNLGRKELGFDDLRVRQGISHAINRQAIVDSVFFGHGVATYGPLPSEQKWYNPQVESFNQFDTAKAESLLDEAGWSKGSDGIRTKDGNRLSFKCINITDTIENQVMQALSQMLQKVGVEMTASSLSAAAYWPKITNTCTAFALKGLWSSMIDLTQYFIGYLQSPSEALDMANAAYEKWLTAATVPELETAADNYQMVVAEQLQLIPIYTPNGIWAHHKRVVGWSPNTANLYPFYNDVWLSQ
jgi:peptide/nickel transport system substrate-binding protein